MRKTAIRQLELLEREERSRKLERDESLAALGFFCLKLVFAHYLGGLTLDDEDPGEAEARALNYQSRDDYLEALLSGKQSDIKNRFKNATRRLFAAVGLNFDRSPPPALFKAFIGMLNELPDHWLNWLKFTLQQECPAARLAAGSNMSLLPFAIGGLSWRRASSVSRNFRVFTRTKALFLPSVEDLIGEESKACFWVFRRCIHPTMEVWLVAARGRGRAPVLLPQLAQRKEAEAGAHGSAPAWQDRTGQGLHRLDCWKTT